MRRCPSVQRRCKTYEEISVSAKNVVSSLVLAGAVTTALATLATISKSAIKHESFMFYDESRDNRPVAVDIAVRRDKEMQANAGLFTLPGAVLNPGNTA